MKNAALVTVSALILATTPILAVETGSFVVEGTVTALRCFESGTLLGGPDAASCEIELEESPGDHTLVGCDRVAEACRWLAVGDRALLAGVEESGLLSATHVGLSLPIDEPGEVGDSPWLLELPYRQLYYMNGLWLLFEDVIEDSRCPADVTCIWAGRCTVALSLWEQGPAWSQATYLGTFELTLGEDPDAADLWVRGYFIRLSEMLPIPRTDIKPIDPSECSLLLQVVELAITPCEHEVWCPLNE